MLPARAALVTYICSRFSDRTLDEVGNERVRLRLLRLIDVILNDAVTYPQQPRSTSTFAERSDLRRFDDADLGFMPFNEAGIVSVIRSTGTRVAPNSYNDLSDIDRLIEARAEQSASNRI